MNHGPDRPDRAGEPREPRPEDWQEAERELERQSASAARLFDVRRVIGVLFVVYGVLVTLAGAFASEADLRKAQGININLWTGLGMLLLGLLFLLWLRLSPTVPPPPSDAQGTGAGARPPAGP